MTEEAIYVLEKMAHGFNRMGRQAGRGFYDYEEGEPPELGYWLGEPYWGRGIMSEAVKGLIEAAFATRLFPRLKARALASNDGSLNVLTKAGFIRTGSGPDPAGANQGKPVVFFELEQPKWS